MGMDCCDRFLPELGTRTFARVSLPPSVGFAFKRSAVIARSFIFLSLQVSDPLGEPTVLRKAAAASASAAASAAE